MKILIIDDDKDVLDLLERQLSKSGYETFVLKDSSLALEKIELYKPDLLIMDLLMPKVDGYKLIEDIREHKEYASIKIIVASAKTFEYDRKRAYELGANAYLEKPVKQEKLLETIKEVLGNEARVTFWGTRGTIPKPGKSTLRFGGNTSCVSVEFTKDRLFIFDAGTGIIELGKYLISQKIKHKMNLLISHPHWDHIQGLPFFIPAYIPGNEIAVYGSSHGDLSLREVISGQMDSIYFPITIKEFGSRIYFSEVAEGSCEVEGISVDTIMLNHPGIAIGYKLTSPGGKTLAYITDNEIPLDDVGGQDNHFRQKLVKFLNEVDLLMHDTTYFDDEYKSKVGWGHPPLTGVLKLAADAKVKNLYLCHHDPDHNDNKVAEKEAFAINYCEKHKLDLKCFAAVEGSTITI